MDMNRNITNAGTQGRMGQHQPSTLSLDDAEVVPSSILHKLAPLPYDYSALEPAIDGQTLKLHHDKHHAAYVEKLNTALQHYPDLYAHTAQWLLCNLEQVPQAIREAVRQNAGGHVNHSFFWQMMSHNGGGSPTGDLAAALEQEFGGFEQFKAAFEAAGGALFGSGWVWLVRDQESAGRLKIMATSGHDNPMMQGYIPLLVNDVWEHAYYLKYENRRTDYLQAWWSIVYWDGVAARFEHPETG